MCTAFNTAFAAEVRALRTGERISQNAAARLARTSQSAWSRAELGQVPFTMEEVARFYLAVGVLPTLITTIEKALAQCGLECRAERQA